MSTEEWRSEAVLRFVRGAHTRDVHRSGRKLARSKRKAAVKALREDARQVYPRVTAWSRRRLVEKIEQEEATEEGTNQQVNSYLWGELGTPRVLRSSTSNPR